MAEFTGLRSWRVEFPHTTYLENEGNIMEKTHYRKAFNSPYLSSADIVEGTNLTVKCVKLESDKTKKTKDHFNTAYFVESEIRQGEPLKPLILNATNSKMMKAIAESAFIDDWQNIPIMVYVDHNVRMMGETMDGLRITTQPARKRLMAGGKQFDNAVEAFKRDGNLNAVRERVDVPADIEALVKKAAEA